MGGAGVKSASHRRRTSSFILQVLNRRVSPGPNIAHLLPGFSKPRNKRQSLSLKFRYSGYQFLHTVPPEDLAKEIPLGQRSSREHLRFLEQSTWTQDMESRPHTGHSPYNQNYLPSAATAPLPCFSGEDREIDLDSCSEITLLKQCLEA